MAGQKRSVLDAAARMEGQEAGERRGFLRPERASADALEQGQSQGRAGGAAQEGSS